MDNSWCHFSTSYKALSQVPELRILVAISGHINMNISIHRSIQPVSLLVLVCHFRIQSECRNQSRILGHRMVFGSRIKISSAL